jgi:hypothetical protein
MNECVYPCDCYVHDMVAELLGIVSTTGKDFRPAAERAQSVLDREAARKKLLPRPQHTLSDDEALRVKHQQYLDAKLAAQTLNEQRREQQQQQPKRDPLKALRKNKEIRAELLRQQSFGSDVATVGYHRPQARQTPPMPSCGACGSSRVREISSKINEPSEAVCGDCWHQGHVWMGQY